MARGQRSEDLRRFTKGESGGRNVSMMDDNLRAIENLVKAAASPRAGIISVYRPIDEYERRELSKYEHDEIANAYHVELAGSDKVYYITYKPSVEKSGSAGSKLEHLNRSTPFVQMLLDKISSEYSFLFCRSRARVADYELPHAARGFRVTAGEREHLDGKNKYELFFLIECKDNIDANERLTNIIDSVLLDVDESCDDFFSQMTYASLEHAAEDDESELPEIERSEARQLNEIITSVREEGEVRQRILDFLAESEESELYAHLRRRNEAFRAAREASQVEVNALNSTVTCRMMPIGVFLNSIDNDRIPYTVTDGKGNEAVFYVELNPAVKFAGHVCPHCGAPITERNGLVLTDGLGERVGCLSCAEKCKHKGCNTYVFSSDGCAVCGKIFCAEHSHKSADSADRLCGECVRVFRDSASGLALSPRDAAVRGEDENFVESEVGRLGKTGALNKFRGEKLLRKTSCVRCLTREGYKYYRSKETGACDKCGEHFYEGDLRKTTDGAARLCFLHRVECSCGKVVSIESAKICAHEGCSQGFCNECASGFVQPKGYLGAVALLGKSKPKAVATDGKIYCNRHAEVCKVCGRIFPIEKLSTCEVCGGKFCPECGDRVCYTCGAARRMTRENYKNGVKRRRYRINALPFAERRGGVGIAEDHEHVLFVSFRGLGKRVRLYDKLTGKLTEIEK